MESDKVKEPIAEGIVKAEEAKPKKKWVCPTCHREADFEAGLTKENFRRMLKKPNAKDWGAMLLVLMIILTVYGYFDATRQCNDWKQGIIDNPQGFCNKLLAGEITMDTAAGLGIINLNLSKNQGQ